MLRRTFLLGTACGISLAAVPLPVFGNPIPDMFPHANKLGVIEQAVNAADKLGFTPFKSMQMFGLYPLAGREYKIGDVRKGLTDFTVGNLASARSVHTWNRMRYVVAIHDRVKTEYWNADHGAILDNLYVHDALFDHRKHTVRELMLFGQAALHCVADDLGAGIKEHDYHEMITFG